MIWLQLIIAIIQLLTKLPAIAETLERIFGSFPRSPLKAAGEARRCLKACEAKLAVLNAPLTVSTPTPCPLLAYVEDLAQRMSAIA